MWGGEVPSNDQTRLEQSLRLYGSEVTVRMWGHISSVLVCFVISKNESVGTQLFWVTHSLFLFSVAKYDKLSRVWTVRKLVGYPQTLGQHRHNKNQCRVTQESLASLFNCETFVQYRAAKILLGGWNALPAKPYGTSRLARDHLLCYISCFFSARFQKIKCFQLFSEDREYDCFQTDILTWDIHCLKYGYM